MIQFDENPTENQDQKALFSWWNNPKTFPYIDKKLFFAIPNSAGHGKMRTVAGARVGLPDLFLAYPVGDDCGLFIELKRKKGGHLRVEQKEYLERFERVGYACAVCRGFENARDTIINYLTDDAETDPARDPFDL